MNRILNSIKTHSGFIGGSSVILILAIVFHYPIHIVDALTSEPVPDYGIKISAWRMIFEPFTGPLLFYLRADQPLSEFIVLIIWIISLSLVISFIPILITKDSSVFIAVIHKFLAWLRKAPLIFSIWLGLLLVTIFVHLPANTIVNNLENTILIKPTAIQNTVTTELFPRQASKNGINIISSMLFLSPIIIIMKRL